MPARSKKRASDVNEQESAGSDGSYSPVDVPAKKRARNSASTKSASKGVDVEQGRDLVTRILANSTSSALTDNEDPMDALLLVAKYARYLENMVVASASQVAAAKPSPEQIHAAAEKLRKAACSQIRKQMTWKPSCKTGSAKWSYDGIASNPEVFASLLDLDSVGWKQKKFTLKEFSDAMGCEPQGSARYHTLYITSDINIKWNPSTGEFKFSGTYGRPV